MAETTPPRSLGSLPPEGAVGPLGRPCGTDIETLKAEARKANAKATQAKMDLHDLSEELPTNWQKILEVAQTAYDAHATLMAARKALADAQAA